MNTVLEFASISLECIYNIENFHKFLIKKLFLSNYKPTFWPGHHFVFDIQVCSCIVDTILKVPKNKHFYFKPGKVD